MTGRALAEQIDALLPQTQCTKCGYGGCLPYARRREKPISTSARPAAPPA